jgi:hypothetical protein
MLGPNINPPLAPLPPGPRRVVVNQRRAYALFIAFKYLPAMMPQRSTTKEIKEMLRFYKQVAERIDQRQNDRPFGRILKQWRDRRARKGGRRG